jgi:Flp pilus assembly protein TadD
LKAINDAQTMIADAREALAGGRSEDALASARAALAVDGDSTEARLLVAKSLARLSRHREAVDELRRAVQADPITPEVHLDLGFAAIRVGDFANAHASFEHFLRLSPTSADVGRVRAALEILTRLQHVLEAHADV